jgi:hypothetical protein
MTQESGHTTELIEGSPREAHPPTAGSNANIRHTALTGTATGRSSERHRDGEDTSS